MSKEFWYGFTSVQIMPDVKRRHRHVLDMDPDTFMKRMALGQLAFVAPVFLSLIAVFVLLVLGFPEWVTVIFAVIVLAVYVVQFRADLRFFP